MAIPVAPIALGLTSLLGGFLGKNKGIDMRAWERMFGPEAVAALTNQFMKQFASSPWARQQEVAAANTGQQIANQFAAMPGARTSGVGQVSQALSGGATNSLQQQLQAMLFQMAMQAAQQNLGDKQSIFLHNQQQPSFLQQLGPALSGAASQTLAALPIGKTPSVGQTSLSPQLMSPMPTSGFGPFDPRPNTGLSFFDQFSNRAVGAR